MLNIDSILWPCELSRNLKESLLSIAQPTDNLLNGHEQGLFYVVQGLAFAHFAPETIVNTMNSAVIRKGIWIGSSQQNKRIHVHSHIEEVNPLTLLYFPKDKISKLCDVNPETYKFLYHTRDTISSTWLTSQLVSLFDKETRIVFALTQLAEHSQSIQGSVIRLELSQKQLSIITGISRPRLNEVLKSLEQSNEVSLERGSIFINDLAKLKLRLYKIEKALIVE